MKERLEKYFDSLFKDAPDTNQVREIRAEIFQNTYDKYCDLLAQGKSEETSFTQAVSGIGDIESVFNDNNISPDVISLEDKKNVVKHHGKFIRAFGKCRSSLIRCKAWLKKKPLSEIITMALFAIALGVYTTILSATGIWHFSLMVFLIAYVGSKIVKNVFELIELCKDKEGYYENKEN